MLKETTNTVASAFRRKDSQAKKHVIANAGPNSEIFRLKAEATLAGNH